MKDYGAQIPCPECGGLHHITPRQLQAETQIGFTCIHCGHQVVVDNAVAIKIHHDMVAIRQGLGRIKI